MKEFKGTPGPWLWQSDEYGHFNFLGPQGCETFSCVIDDGSACGEYLPAIDVKSPDAKLIEAAPELLKALQWALPLARIAMDTHRMERIKYGHTDIIGTYSNGESWVGIHQSEVDDIEFAQNTVKKALGEI